MGGGMFGLIERGTEYLNAYVRRRRVARAMQAMLERQVGGHGFAGAAVGRLSASLATWSGAINSDLDGSIEILRARGRALWANNEYGTRFCTLVENNIVGEGFNLQVRATANDKLDTAGNALIESAFADWSRRADIGGRMSLAHMLRVAASTLARDGEVMIQPIRDRKLPYGFALRLLEADRLEHAINQRLSNGNMIRMGVECDPNGKAVAWHMRDQHPGEQWQAGPGKIVRVPLGEMYHFFIVRRPEQVRGITWFHPVVNRMNMLAGFEEAAVVAARVGAAKMGVITKSLDAPGVDNLAALADQVDGSTGMPQISAEPGEFPVLPPGYELQSWNPEYPHANFDAFLKACLRGAAAGLNVASHNLTGDMSEVNYSSARIAELAERDCWKVLQAAFIDGLAWPIFNDWLDAALISKSLSFPSGSVLPATTRDKWLRAATLTGRRWQWVDPQKEIAAARERVAMGVASRKTVAAEAGIEFSDVVADLAAEKSELQTAGLDAWIDAPLGHKAGPVPNTPGQGVANGNA